MLKNLVTCIKSPCIMPHFIAHSDANGRVICVKLHAYLHQNSS